MELKSSIDDLEIGDVNIDGNVNVADLVLLQHYIVNSVKYLDDSTLADVSQDNVINVFDAVLLRNKLLK